MGQFRLVRRGGWSLASTGQCMRVLLLCVAGSFASLAPQLAIATCDTAGKCCAGRDVYFCKADGSANVSMAPLATCDASGCGHVNAAGSTGCASSGAVDPAKTAFCSGHCQAGCTGATCPGTCLAGSLCVNGVCTAAGCGVVSDWRKTVWSGDTAGGVNSPFVAAPSSGIRSLCHGLYWSYGIKKDGSLVQWGYQHDTNNLFGNAALAKVSDAVQIACSRWRLSVLHADGTLNAYGDSPYGQAAMPAGLTGIKSVAATTDSVGWVAADGSIAMLPATIGFNQFNGNKAWQTVFGEQKGSGTYRTLSASGAIDAGYIAIKTDGSVVVAARKLDFGPWPVAPPAAVKDVVAAAVSFTVAAALKQDGTVVVWDQDNKVIPNPAGIKPCVAVAVWSTAVAVALQVDGTIVHWGSQSSLVTQDSRFNALSGAAAKLTGVTALDPSGMGPLFCVGKCGAVSETGCCNGNTRYWCDAVGALQSEACSAGTCGWQTQKAHFCDGKCGGSGNGCYCDASCVNFGDCCNATGDAKAGNACGGSTCGACKGSASAVTPNVYQCATAGGSAPGGGQVPLKACMCVPNCAGKSCGSDGCGGTCDKGGCDDGDACTQSDKCTGESCAGTPVNCSDNNPCTADVCSASGGKPTCSQTNTTDACNDGNACTVGDVCAKGACTPGPTPLKCDDANVCTSDACDPKAGCAYLPAAAPCSDNNACTVGDACQAGKCTAGGTVLNCNDGNACTDDSCDKASGCKYTAKSGTPCDDASSCTANDLCNNGKCTGSGALDCNDGNPCTKDDCANATTCAAKAPINEGLGCSDGNVCHLGATCSGGTCGGFKDQKCDDGNPCTDDTCNAKSGCIYTPNAVPCSDNNACTGGDACKAGSCAGGPTLAACNDGNPCTDDCDPASGCGSKANSATCDDGSLCTLKDQCAGGTCLGSQAKPCDDGNACTLDNCNAKLGCQYAPSGGACSDGNVCTQGDACWQGTCKAGAAIGCSDSNPCTTDVCDAAKGCTTAPNSLPCDDKNACTIGDLCSNGACSAGKTAATCDDGNPCTTDSCNPSVGCLSANHFKPCDDGLACTTGDTCANGICKGQTKQCDDGNLCTDDACNAAGTCTHPANSAPCDDGNWTTVGDKCEAGACKPGKNPCDDNNPCTLDAATIEAIYGDSGWGGQIIVGFKPACAHVPVKPQPCDDSDVCTSADVCSNGTCVGSPLCVGGTCAVAGGKPNCTCPSGATQTKNGAFTVCCMPNCSGKVCGSDGCGGTCGAGCKADEKCSADALACEPKVACWGKAPTDHACCDGRVVKRCNGTMSLAAVNCKATGQYCGWSAAKQDYACTNDGVVDPNPDANAKVAFACPVVDAKCVPDCKGRVCGPDGCGGSCGACAAGSSCDPLAGSCQTAVCGGAVPPTRCVKNLVWHKFADDADADAFFAKFDKTAQGQDRWFLGCGCANGTLDANGVCNVPAYKSTLETMNGRPIINAKCLMRFCGDQKAGPDGLMDYSCPEQGANANDALYSTGLAWWGKYGVLNCPQGSFSMANTTPVLIGSPGIFSKNPGQGVVWKGLLPKLQKDHGIPKVIGCNELKNATCSWPTKRVCGIDDASKSCGTCPSGQACKGDGSACEQTDCGKKVCGNDSTGKSCGSCPLGQSCSPDGICSVCSAENAELCTATGELQYCVDSAVFKLKCNEAKDPVSGAKAFKVCGSLPGLSNANTCFVPVVGTCSAKCTPTNGADAEAGSTTPKCSCDPSCEAAGTCCKGWELCGQDKLKAVCGNKKCEPVGGENGVTCPADCPAAQVCANAALPQAPWPQQIEGVGTLTARVKQLVQAGFDVRPRAADIPTAGLIASVPEAGVVVGLPRGVAGLLRSDESLAADASAKDGAATTVDMASTTVGTVAGIDGLGILIDGQQDEGSGKLRRAALTMGGDGALRRNPSQLAGTHGGFTVAAWVKVSQGSAALPNALGASEDLGSGAWTDAAVADGHRPGHREVCFASRPGDARLAISCNDDNIADLQAYWGDAGEHFLPDAANLNTCYEWRKVPRTGVCNDPGITERLRLTCVGKKTCVPDKVAIGANTCQGVAGSKPRLLVRALCGPAPAGANLWIEGQTGSAACKGAACPSGPSGRLVLQVPVAVPNPPAQYADSKGKIAKWSTLTLRSGGGVPTNQWFHVAVAFRPDQVPVDATKVASVQGVWSLYFNGLLADQGYGRAPLAVGWHWGRGFVAGMQSSWPNVFGSKLVASDVTNVDTPFNAVANASFDDLFAYDRALVAQEVRALAQRPSGGALRVWPPVAAEALAAENLWTTGGKVEAVPIELPWLRDAGACAADAKASGLVRASFDGVRVSGASAVLAMPADGADLDGLETWTAMAWLRAPAVTAGTVLLDIKQGAASRVRLEVGAGCGGRALRAVFAGGKAVEQTNCDHVLAPAQWVHVFVAQTASQRLLVLDGGVATVAAGAGTLFDKAGLGARRVVTTPAADLGFVSLYRGELGRSSAAAARTTGPVVWLSGAALKAGVPVDYANFHNETSTGPVDAVSLVNAAGAAASADWTEARVPLRGRLAPDAGLAIPPLSVSISVLPASGGTAGSKQLAQASNGKAGWRSHLRCVPQAGELTCDLFFVVRDGVGGETYLQSGTIYKGPASPEGGIPVAFSVSGTDIAAPSFIDGVQGIAAMQTVSAGVAGTMAFSQPAKAGQPTLSLFQNSGAFASYNLRVWYGAGGEDNLAATQATTCADKSLATTCTSQNRKCQNLAGATGGAPVIGACTGCADGYGDALGACLAKKPAMQACTISAECASGPCVESVCKWDEAHKADCAAECALLGHTCEATGASYACVNKCLPDFALVDTVAVAASQPGYFGLKLCQWAPSLDPGAACARNSQCKGSGACVANQEDLVKVDPAAAGKVAMTEGAYANTVEVKYNDDNYYPKYSYVHYGPNWTCQSTSATENCAASESLTGAVGRCLMPNGAQCTNLNREALAAKGNDYLGQSQKGAVCGGCLQTLNSETNLPVYEKRRRFLEPKACATIVNNYSKLADWNSVFPLTGGSACANATLAAPYYAQNFSWLGLQRKAGKPLTALLPNGTNPDYPLKKYGDSPSEFVGFGHLVGGNVYQQFAPPDLNLVPINCKGVGGVFPRRGDILSYTPDLQVLGYLLGVAVPATIAQLNKDQIVKLRNAGVGSAAMAAIAHNEGKPYGQWQHFNLQDCMAASYDYYHPNFYYGANSMSSSGWVTKQTIAATMFDPNVNGTRCTYKQQPLGTTCPYDAKKDNVDAANSMCESYYCGYDTGKCAEAVTEVEQVKGSTTDKSSGALNDEFGAFRFTHSSEAAIRFGRYPKHTIFQSIGLPMGTEAEITAPLPGQLKDNRHLQARAFLKADAFFPVPKSLHGTTGKSELDWTLCDFDLGYTIVPGHKRAHKKVRYAAKIALLGLTFAQQTPRPSVGEPCEDNAPKTCGYADDNAQAALTCQNKKWAYVAGDKKCGPDTTCDELPAVGFSCVPNLAVDLSCSNQVRDGNYVPPSDPKNKCKIVKMKPTLTNGSDVGLAVPNDTGIDLLDIKFPTLGGECSVAKQLEVSLKTGKPTPFWTQGLAKKNFNAEDIVDSAASDATTGCLKLGAKEPKKSKGAKVIESCMQEILNKYAGAPGTPPTKACFRASPVWIGPLPLTFEAEAAPVLRFKAGIKVDDTTFEPAVFLRPSLGVEIEAVAKFDLNEVLGIKPLMAAIESKSKVLAKILKFAAKNIQAEAGIAGELAIVEVAFPITWSLAMIQQTRQVAPTVKYSKDGNPNSTLSQGEMIPDLWKLVAKFEVDLELTLLRLTLKLFYKFGITFLWFNPQIEKEMPLFTFGGFVFNWKLNSDVLAAWRTDFGWTGPKFPD